MMFPCKIPKVFAGAFDARKIRFPIFRVGKYFSYIFLVYFTITILSGAINTIDVNGREYGWSTPLPPKRKIKVPILLNDFASLPHVLNHRWAPE